MTIRIGTRKSALAIKQTEAVIEQLKPHFPGDTFEIIGISTEGDLKVDKSLKSFGGKGAFIKEIETALLDGEINMAVHSAKDLPTELPDGLEISAALLRADRRDVLVYFSDADIKVIGTGSARREAQAKKLFPNAEFKSIRGNIHTRLDKVRRGEYDAVIMAMAAINRLGIADAHVKPLDFVCAAGQGVLAVETVKGKMQKYTAAINDSAVMTELTAERAFLSRTGGGCHAPCGASAVFDGQTVTMRTFFSDGENEVSLEMSGTDPSALGIGMAEKTLELLKKGQK